MPEGVRVDAGLAGGWDYLNDAGEPRSDRRVAGTVGVDQCERAAFGNLCAA
jgi:hypothetical protein